jgi:uncharacterized protein YecE (DUF72 family)
MMRIGTAGWSIPRAAADRFPGAESHLARYSRVLNCSEINTSFYRSHLPETYEKWARQTPSGFRFAVKLPRVISHEQRLRGARAGLEKFMGEVAGLGDKLGAVLVQLPPSQVFEARQVRIFFEAVARLYGGPVVCEPRHESWLSPAADRLLSQLQVGRVAADPARSSGFAVPGGWVGARGDGAGAVIYYRWHGSPRIYFSEYGDDWLQQKAKELRKWPRSAKLWCIFDNTASGAAAPDALRMSTYQ